MQPCSSEHVSLLYAHGMFDFAGGNHHEETQIPHHHQIPPSPVPLQMEVRVPGSLILIDQGDHCDLA